MAEGAEPSAEGGITFSEQCWNELLMLSALHQIRVRCITIHCSLSVNLQQVRSGPVRCVSVPSGSSSPKLDGTDTQDF